MDSCFTLSISSLPITISCPNVYKNITNFIGYKYYVAFFDELC